LTEVDIKDQAVLHMQPSYIESRIRHGAQSPLNVVSLKRQLELMRQGPHFTRINAELQPGDAPGQSRLEVKLEEADPLYIGLQFDNSRPPSVGAERLRLLMRHQNVLGLGDSFFLNYGIARDLLDQPEFDEDKDIDVGYTLPVTASDTTLSFRYTRTNSLLIEDPFAVLDITSNSESYALGIRQPIYRTPDTEFALFLMGEHRTNQTYLSAQPFSFSAGAMDGESKVTVVRFAQELIRRDVDHVLAFRSTFNFGTDLLDATHHSGDVPDGQFFSWQGQMQYVQRLWDTSNQAIVRVNTQIASDALLSLEQISIGGVNTVRGYRENQLVRDNAVILGGELRLAILQDESGRPLVQLAPFVDFGNGWNTNGPHNDEHIGSAGIGVLVHLFDRVDGQLYWGVPFRQFHASEHDLQDSGIHFSLTVRVY
jgi:hemolysin activation/secretion protein